jgi:uncharacterized protein with von Willebrand factor type A (vWA) domain
MLNRVQEFAGLLRRNGVRTSTAEVLDAVNALLVCDLGDFDAVRAALAATLIKQHEDEAVFHELFSLFFFRPGQFLQQDEAPLVKMLRAQGLSEEELERILAILADQAARLDPTARMALGLRRSDVEALFRLAGLRFDFGRLQNPLQIGFFTQQVLGQLRFAEAESQLAALGGGLAASLGAQRSAQIMQQVQANLGALRATVRGYVKDEFEKRNIRYADKMRRELLQHKPFAAMSLEELHRLHREIERMAQKLRTQASLRPRHRRRGRLDIRRTLRSALSSGGTPFALKLRHRRVEKPRLCILCDISDSVRHVSRFMLQFVYTLQEMFSKVRSFVFVSDLGEATDLFSRYKLDAAVERALSGEIIHVYANSNYGRALRQFVERHLEAVTTRTTVIVIGDGRSNYFPPEAWALGRVRARARHVLWLNPEQPASWMFGDSAMRDYEPHVSRVEVVYNLDSLRQVIDELVL